jgi:putative transposase
MPLDSDQVRRIVVRVVDHAMAARVVARQAGVSRRRVEQLAKEYRDTRKIPVLGRPGRPPAISCPVGLPALILRLHDEVDLGAAAIGDILRKRHDIHVGTRTVHEHLRRAGRVRDEPNKRVRKTPWIRYERTHPLSLVHMDWHYLDDDRKLCTVLDDCSRKILAAIELDAISAEASVALLKKAYDENRWICPIAEVITDHGSEFYAMKRGQDGRSAHLFEQYCLRTGIRHVLCRVKHPQSNGKIERFHATYDKSRHKHPTLQEFVEWYNAVRPHMSLDWDNLETPDQAFMRRSQDIRLGNFLAQLEATPA